MLKPRIGLAVTYHPYEEGAENASALSSRTRRTLDKLGLAVVPAKELVHNERTAHRAGEEFRKERVDLICLPLATWSSDHLVLDMLEQVDVPIITWAFPGINTGSLCGCQQIDCVLKELNKEYKFVYGDNERAHQQIQTYSRAVALARRMRTARIGLIGYRTVGMTEVAFDEYALKSVLGPRVVQMGVDKLRRSIDAISEKEARSLWTKAKKQVGKVTADDDDGLYAVKAYLALKKFVRDNSLSGLTTECYPELMGQVCLAHSLLSEEGVVAACEGDVNSTAAMLMLYKLTGNPVHNTDLLAVYEEDNSILLSHCGSGGFSLAERREDIILGPVRLANRGVCVLFPSKTGKVTMVNLVGRKDTYRMCVVVGQAIPTEMVFPGNPIRVRIPTSTDELLGMIANEGFGHHWMIGYGDVGGELEELGSLVGIRTVLVRETAV